LTNTPKLRGNTSTESGRGLQQEQRQEPPMDQRQHQSHPNPPPPPLTKYYIPPPTPPLNHIPHHQPPSPQNNQYFQPPPSPHHNSAPQNPRVHWPTTFNLHHGLRITEPCLHLNIMETPTLTNFSCAIKLPQPQSGVTKPPSLNLL
jgi:hypothetical protein